MKGVKIVVWICVVSFLVGLTAASIQARPINGQWRLTFYNDASNLSQQASQNICFEGGPELGTWYSSTFPNWGGTWWRKGAGANSNVIVINGNYDDGEGNDAGKVEFIANSLITGSWVEWRDDGSHQGNHQVRLISQKRICDRRMTAQSSSLENPANQDQGEITSEYSE